MNKTVNSKEKSQTFVYKNNSVTILNGIKRFFRDFSGRTATLIFRQL